MANQPPYKCIGAVYRLIYVCKVLNEMCKYHPIIPKPSAYKNSYIAINNHQYLCICVYADRERQTDRRNMKKAHCVRSLSK